MVLLIPNPLGSYYLRYLPQVLTKCWSCWCRVPWGLRQHSHCVLVNPEGHWWFPSLLFQDEAVSTAIAGIFIKKRVAPHARPDNSLCVTQMWLWLCRQMVFKSFGDCRVALGMPLEVGFTLRTCLPENHIFPWCWRQETSSQVF